MCVCAFMGMYAAGKRPSCDCSGGTFCFLASSCFQNYRDSLLMNRHFQHFREQIVHIWWKQKKKKLHQLRYRHKKNIMLSRTIHEQVTRLLTMYISTAAPSVQPNFKCTSPCCRSVAQEVFMRVKRRKAASSARTTASETARDDKAEEVKQAQRLVYLVETSCSRKGYSSI